MTVCISHINLTQQLCLEEYKASLCPREHDPGYDEALDYHTT
jgi:hypothetical protein